MNNPDDIATAQDQSGCEYCRRLVDDVKNGIRTPDSLELSKNNVFQCFRCNTIWNADIGDIIFLPIAYSKLLQRYNTMMQKKPEFIRWGLAYAMCNNAIYGDDVLTRKVRMAMLYSAIVMYFSPMSGGRKDYLREAVMKELATIDTHSYIEAFKFFREMRHKYIAHLSEEHVKTVGDSVAIHVPNFFPHGIKFIVFHPPAMKTFGLGYMTSFRSLVDVTMRIMFFKYDGTNPVFRNLNLLSELRKGYPSNLYQQ